MEWKILELWVFLVGILIGSFLNVCIYRIPKKEDIVFGRSHCMSCGNVLKWYELIPIFSYLLQRGRCRSCKTKLSLQYPLVELLNGILYVWIFQLYRLHLETLLFCLCSSVLLVLSVIDDRTFEIPPACSLIIGLLGGIRLMTDFSHAPLYLIGFFAVSAIFLLIYLLTSGNGIGGGDIKLMAAAGLLLGWKKILLALFLASVLGSVIHLSLMKLVHKGRVLAFGPYLATGIWLSMLYGDAILKWYLAFLGF